MQVLLMAVTSVAETVLVRVMLNRLSAHVVKILLPEIQCGFRTGRVTIDMIVLSLSHSLRLLWQAELTFIHYFQISEIVTLDIRT